MRISIIVPCNNEQEALPVYYAETIKVLTSINNDYEMIFIDDGSKDGSLSIIKGFAKQNSNVKYISFSRNFGKEAAMYAGMKNASGDLIAIMDCDMQDPPSLLPEMVQKVGEEGIDCVATRRVTRKGEPKIRSFFAKAFYRLINRISDAKIVDGARDYRVMTRRMVDSILELGECHRFSKGLFQWVGFDTIWLEFENANRIAGETKWSFWKLLRYAIEGIVSFSTFPLRIASFFGLLASVTAIIYFLVLLIRTIFWGTDVPGYPSIMVTILLSSGLILIGIGIIGEYLARTYMQTKNRPIYISRESNINKE